MNTTVVDTLKLAEEFSEAGFEEKKAKILAEKIGTLANDHLVTQFSLRNELEKLELRLTIKMTVIVTAVLSFFKVMENLF